MSSFQYILEIKHRSKDIWEKSAFTEGNNGGFDSLRDLIGALVDSNSNMPSYADYRIRKVPEQPEEEVLE